MEPVWICLLLCALHITLPAVWSKHFEQRNLFTQRVCCKRQSHFVYIGQDISGAPVNVDVGLCMPHCAGAARGPQEAPQRDFSKHPSMLDFIRSKKRPRGAAAPHAPAQKPSCGPDQVCEPTGMRVERVLLLEGPREVEVIEDCHCEIRIAQCLRVPALRTYYADTPYETVIDVGGCSRSKGAPDGFSCVPTRFDSALVETPNKAEVIEKVEVCELKESCYRVPHVEYYYETVQQRDGVREERLKEIDVGRCLGGCASGNRCLLRSASDPAMCHLWAERQASACLPQGYESHSFMNQHMQMRTVLSISSCLCQE